MNEFMSDDAELMQKVHSPDLEALSTAIRALAKESSDDSLMLLALLRTLEGLHREICEGLFQESLPNNRQALYALLRDIENSGGWPYIHRMRLQDFMKNLLIDEEDYLETGE